MELPVFMFPDSAELRRQAEVADLRALAAKRDRDLADEMKWRDRALALRRRARELEFSK